MVEKNYLGRTYEGEPVYRIATGLYRESDGNLIKMEEPEIEDFVLGQNIEDDDYPDEFYDKFAPVEELLGDTRLTY